MISLLFKDVQSSHLYETLQNPSLVVEQDNCFDLERSENKFPLAEYFVTIKSSEH